MPKKKNSKKFKKTESIKKQNSEISPLKKRIFTFITIFFPIFLLALLELCLHIFNYGGNTRLFIPTPHEDSDYYGINVDVCRRYFYMDDFVPTPRKDLFLREKPRNGYRIFVLGGSTTAGFPYGNNVTFSRILHRQLADTFPDKRIEVINVAMTAINSYTMLDFMDEILAQKPDALLIYTGHNEFYGALGVSSMQSLGKIRFLVKAGLKLQKYRTFLLLRNTIGQIRQKLGGNTMREKLKDPMKTVMSRIVKDQTIPYGSTVYRSGEKQFEKNLNDIFKKTKKAGVKVLISDLVCNIRDQAPFSSVAADTLPPALTIFKKAKQQEQHEDYAKARQLYYRAKDLDAIRFRAAEDFNKIIYRQAKFFNIPVVPMKSMFETASPNGLIGSSLIHEHLHPNIDGYFLMADAFYNSMRKEHFISDLWREQFIKPGSYYRLNWGYTKLDSVTAALNILHLRGGWPFTKDSQPNLVLQNFKPTSKEDSLALRILGIGDITLEMAHVEMAQYYERTGDYERAFNEYKALIYTVPTQDIFYEYALKFLLSTKQYERILEVFTDALRYHESSFLYKWIGQINLTLEQTNRGIYFLEKARQMAPEDTQILFNLTFAYLNLRHFNEADNMLNQLKRIDPASPFVKQLETFQKSLHQNN
ncbi:hypothetical protein JXQ31_08020 [candidate division KSB1 bacterium]|nr:hypothetical protein [candidate division KSB1 bacterium]